MGILDWLTKKVSISQTPADLEPSEMKKTFSKRERQEMALEGAISLEKLESPKTKVLSPPVEHPLLTIQDRISKLEDIYRQLNEKIASVDQKMATRHDIDDVKVLINEDLAKGNKILHGIDSIDSKVDILRKAREELTHDITTSRRKLTRVDASLTLLESHQKILAELRSKSQSTVELHRKLGFTRQYLWNRLKELENAGIVEKFRDSRQTKYRVLQ
jgi:DNA-binding transcriptional ArsR family regulator